MPTYLAPDIYVEEIPSGTRPIESVGTSTAGFVGTAPNPKAHLTEAYPINNWTEFVREFCTARVNNQDKLMPSTNLSQAVYGFFLNGGSRCYIANVPAGQAIAGGAGAKTGLALLEQLDEIAIVCAPGCTDAVSYDAVISHCESLKNRVGILDAPLDVDATDIDALTKTAEPPSAPGPGGGGSGGTGGGGGSTPSSQPQGLKPRQSDGGYAAFYFPWIQVRDPLPPANPDPNAAQASVLVMAPPSGHIAGVWARTDGTRGVHKAPANEPVRGALKLAYPLTRAEQGELNSAGVNCIRTFPREGIRVWGARTLAASASEWRYLNVRRLVNMIEESIALNTRWIVFEPNDMTLWKSIRRDISAFLMRMWRDGALMGATPAQAFFVKCDAETNPPDIIDAGQVVAIIGIAPVKPAEFVVFRISQYAGGVETENLGA
ncbi:MAG: phage tail sheath subtilisin-like domain-containing protein [Chloroflexi bacterium]|nr:phage tail sheath subtilisin-like domain-containing protein [Chloroflexota bacterium]